MYHRPRFDSVPFAAFVAVVLGIVVTPPLHAQSRGKVLTPPRADSARPRPAGTPTPAPAAPLTAGGARGAFAVPQSAVLDSIREVVFRNLLDRDRAGFATLASAFCLGLTTEDFKKSPASADRADPPESMVRRLYSPRTPARRVSTCALSTAASVGRPVPGRALVYSVGAIDLESPTRAEAAAGYTYDGVSSGGYTFTLERADSGWVVKQWRMEWTGKP